tara:strand:- start:5503 stop:5943 length:441 start_codon:yes stop_codon:yes gene_type:complete
MTDTERIAVGLLGWKPCEPLQGEEHRGYRWYARTGRLDDFPLVAAVTDSDIWAGRAHWPDFTDERLKDFWIRKMEDALAEEGLECRYLTELNSIHTANGEDYEIAKRVHEQMPDEITEIKMGFSYQIGMMHSTPAQRVAACLKVLE